LIVINYNKCREAAFTEYKAEKNWAKFKVGVTAGMTETSLKITKRKYRYEYLHDQ